MKKTSTFTITTILATIVLMSFVVAGAAQGFSEEDSQSTSGLPDVVLKDIDFAPNPEEYQIGSGDLKFIPKISQQGLEAGQQFWVIAKVYDSEDNPVDSCSVLSTYTGDDEFINTVCGVDDFQSEGSYYVFLEIDSDNDIAESNERNNAMKKVFEIGNLGTVDIAVTDITVLPEDPKVGGTITVFAQIENYGEEPEEVNIGYEITLPDGSGFGTGFCCITVYPEEDPYTYSFTFEASQVGHYEIDFSAWPENSEDSDPSNNRMKVEFSVRDTILLIGDFDGNELIRMDDLVQLLGNWGTDNALYDEDGNGVVDRGDLQMLLANWGEGKMLRADIVHLSDENNQHCRVTNVEVAAVKVRINTPVKDTITRLADIDNDGEITEEDLGIMKIQRDLTENDLKYLREDLNCDGEMSGEDIKVLQELWGPKDYHDTWADINQDSTVNVPDLLALLGSPGWN
jgi:Ca2+-binding EF-hand superfamily protein